MIGEYTLEMLCNKYNLSNDKLIKKNRNILDYGEYKEIDETLNYLINKLRIQPENIEKCPSILYRNVNQIVNNINFLKEQKITFSEIESCLHVLSAEYKQLIETYNYVESNYGLQAINKNTSILSCPIKIILSVENLNLNRDFNLPISTSIYFGATTLEEIQKMLHSKEYEEHPELFTSTTLARITLEDIQKILHSKEYEDHPELFTSTTLAFATLEDIQKMLHSKEYEEYPELFTSEVLARTKIEDIQKMLHSKEYEEHPELFTSTTLAFATLEDIQKILHSKEYKAHPELFTSTTLSFAKIEDIQKLLSMDCWNDERYKKLLTSSVVARSKSMILRLPILFNLAEEYGLTDYLNTSFILVSPNQNYALIKYLEENNLKLIIDGKLNPVFGKAEGLLKKKYNIDIKTCMKKYPLEEVNYGGKKI